MRSENEMLEIILQTAREDERIRAAIMNGSRANPNAPRDPFQDFDVVYLVTDVPSFVSDPGWIDRFGERMILQMPDLMTDPPPDIREGFTYLMQFMDGNRIDLSLKPLWLIATCIQDSQTVALLDKDGCIPPLPPPSDRDYLPRPPTEKQYQDCCNEFWWVSPYAAKGLWRNEILYARQVLETLLRPQLIKMLAWDVGARTGFSKNPGKAGKYLRQFLDDDEWRRLLQTCPDSNPEFTWDALLAMAALFEKIALRVGMTYGFSYPAGDAERVSAHLRHVRNLPPDTLEIYP